MELNKNKKMPENIPPNCPLDITSNEMLAPHAPQESILGVAVSLEGYQDRIESRQWGPKTEQDVGYVACLGCPFIDDCRGVIDQVQSEVDERARHPLDLINALDPRSLSEIWASSVVAQAEERGYKQETAANVAGKLTRLPEILQKIAIGVMESDTGNLLKAVGRIEIKGAEFLVLGFENTRLVISKKAVEELEKEGSGKEAMIEKLKDLMSPAADTASDKTELAHAISTGNFNGTDIKKLKNDKVKALEFNGGTGTTTRGFGYILTETVEGKQVPTIFLPVVVSDIKGGQTSMQTDRRAINTDNAFAKVTITDINNAIDLAAEPEVATVAKLVKKRN